MKMWRMVSLVCVLSAAALPVLAQGAQEEPPPIFGEEIDVRVINVEVVVTDGKGNRVKDLKPGDFRLKVDGQPVSIEYFTEIREGQAMAAPAPETPAGLETAAAAEPGAPVGTQYLVFIDDYFLIASQRDDVLRSLKRDLPGLQPADRMSILAWDGGRLSRLSGWTGSREDLGRALDAAMARPTRGLDRVADYQRFVQDDAFLKRGSSDLAGILGGSGGDDLGRRLAASELTPLERDFGRGLARQIDSAVSAVVGAMRGSAAPPGRKVLLLLAGGWPFSIQSYIRRGGVAVLSRELPSGEQLFGSLSRTANLLGYTIYPVDVPGLTSVAADAVENPMEGRDSVIMGMSATSDKPSAPLHEMDFGKQGAMPSQLTDTRTVIEQELQGSLEFLAKETGGKPLLNSNRTLALARVQADTRSYYWLGFSPGWKRDDKSHRIKVEAARPGLTVRSRSDFLDLSKQAEVAMKLESALLFGDGIAGIAGIGGIAGSEHLTLQVGAPVRARKGKVTGVEIPITLGIPVSALTVLPAGGKYAAELELRFAATDDQGNQSDIPSIPVRLSSSQPPPEGGIVRYDTKILLNGKATRLVAAVYDRASGKIAAAESAIAAK